MRRTYLAIGALALVALLVIAGCGGGGSTTSGASAGGEGGEEEAAETEGESASAAGTATTAGVVKVMNTPQLGKVIVDSAGTTPYDCHKDKGTASTCYGTCATDWPPLLTKGSPKAMGGAEASLLGTTKREDGTVQVTYKGHPVYTFFEDKKPGEANGNDVDFFGGEWYALMRNGEEPGGS